MEKRLPGSVALALACLFAFLLASGAMHAQWYGTPAAVLALPAVAAGLLAFGIFRRNRFAWAVGRYVSLFLGLITSVLTLALWTQFGIGVRTLEALAMAVPLFAMGLALGRPPARRWFGVEGEPEPPDPGGD